MQKKNHDPNCHLNILLFWFDDDWGKWGRAYERIAENLSKLPQINNVVCIFPPIPVWQCSSKKIFLDIKKISNKLQLIRQTEINKIKVDAHFTRLRHRYNDFYRLYFLRKKLRQLGFRKNNTILWLFPPHPYIDYLIKHIPHRYVISHVIDNFTKVDPSRKIYHYAVDQYPKLGQFSNAIITTSEANNAYFCKMINSCYMFLPAVDDSFLGKPQLLPHKLTAVSPRLGYVGWIMERTDLDLLKYVALQRTNWRIILAGPEYPSGYLSDSGLLDLLNVEYLGPIQQSDVPKFLWSLDICLIPHRDNEYSRSMGPLKLYQYLASGRPVVSTNVAGLELVRKHVFVTQDQDEFIHHIETALESDTKEFSAERIQVARRNTWPNRVGEMFDTLLKDL